MSSSDHTSPGFEITVTPSGRTFTALPGETILAAGIRAGVGMPYGCKDGACESAKARHQGAPHTGC